MAKKIKIALSLLSGLSYGGVTYYKNLIPALARLDKFNEYHIFLQKGHPLLQVVDQDNFIFYECDFNTRSIFARLFWEQFILPFKLKKRGIDIIFTAKGANILFAPCKTIIAPRNMEPFCYKRYKNYWKLDFLSWLRYCLIRLSIRKADKIIAVSQAVKDQVLKRFPKTDKKIEVVYNGNPVKYDTNQQICDESTNTRIRVFAYSHGIRRFASRHYILTTSKFVAYANQLNLIKAYALLCERKKDTPPLWFAGGVLDKVYFKKVQKYIKEHDLADKIKILGLMPHEKLIELYLNAHMFVFPSTLEACPHTLIEAMACGVPTAASNIPPMPEICGQAVIYFDPFNPKDIAKKIELILTDKLLQERLRRDGLERSAFFTWEKTAQGLIEVFERLSH